MGLDELERKMTSKYKVPAQRNTNEAA